MRRKIIKKDKKRIIRSQGGKIRINLDAGNGQGGAGRSIEPGAVPARNCRAWPSRGSGASKGVIKGSCHQGVRPLDDTTPDGTKKGPADFCRTLGWR